MKVLFHKDFEKEYQRTSPKIRAQFERRLTLFVDEPSHPLLNNHRLHGEFKNLYSINVTGDIRAIYEVINSGAVLFVLFDTHSNLYG